MKALELAELAETTMRPGGLADEVAAELRRLAEVNAELLRALEAAVKYHGNQEGFCPEWLVQAWKAIAKAKEQK